MPLRFVELHRVLLVGRLSRNIRYPRSLGRSPVSASVLGPCSARKSQCANIYGESCLHERIQPCSTTGVAKASECRPDSSPEGLLKKAKGERERPFPMKRTAPQNWSSVAPEPAPPPPRLTKLPLFEYWLLKFIWNLESGYPPQSQRGHRKTKKESER
jgi:hypothetical protein